MEAEKLHTCMACGFTTTFMPMMIAHQSICEKMEPEKREYREDILLLYFAEEDIPKVQELAREAGKKQ